MRRYHVTRRLVGISLHVLTLALISASWAIAPSSAIAASSYGRSETETFTAPGQPPASTPTEAPIPTATETITLWPRLNLFAWPGPTMPVDQALSGPIIVGGGSTDDILRSVSAVWGFDAGTQAWQANFPGTAGIPGANDLAQVVHGGAYAIFVTGAVQWGIATATITPTAITSGQLPDLAQRVAIAVETGDSAALPGLIDAIPVPCEPPTAEPGLGFSPECPPGTPAGTLVGAWVAAGDCTGGYLTADSAADLLVNLAQLHPLLRYVIVAARPVDGFMQIETFLVFQRQGGTFPGMWVGLDSTGIVRVNEGCGSSASELVTLILGGHVAAVASTVYGLSTTDLSPTRGG